MYSLAYFYEFGLLIKLASAPFQYSVRVYTESTPLQK
jgi:hypothetical protein